MKEIKVNKDKLLKILKKNRKNHLKEYAKMIVEYKIELIERAELLVKTIEKQDSNFKHSLGNNEPRNNKDSYDKIISMLEMSVDEEIILDNNQHEQYVMDNWNWTRDFEFSKTSYLK